MNDHSDSRMTPLGAVARGLVAGAAGTFAMGLAVRRAEARVSPPGRPLPPRER